MSEDTEQNLKETIFLKIQGPIYFLKSFLKNRDVSSKNYPQNVILCVPKQFRQDYYLTVFQNDNSILKKERKRGKRGREIGERNRDRSLPNTVYSLPQEGLRSCIPHTEHNGAVKMALCLHALISSFASHYNATLIAAGSNYAKIHTFNWKFSTTVSFFP